VRVLGLSRRFGHQMSLVAGIDACTGDAAVMMDCDMEHPPELIPRLLEKYESGCDVVHTIRKYNKNVSAFKALPSRLFYRVLNLLTTEKFSENAADFRLISRKVIDVFKRDIREHNQFLRGLFKWVGFEQAEVPFVSGVRRTGVSQYTFKRLVKFATQGIVSFSKLPLQISVIIGVVFAVTGLAYGIYNIFAYFFFAASARGVDDHRHAAPFPGRLAVDRAGRHRGIHIGHIRRSEKQAAVRRGRALRIPRRGRNRWPGLTRPRAASGIMSCCTACCSSIPFMRC